MLLAPSQVAEHSDVIFIAVKPQYVGLVLKEMKGQLKKDTIIVSIAAGVPLAAMKVTPSALPPLMCNYIVRAPLPCNKLRLHNECCPLE